MYRHLRAVLVLWISCFSFVVPHLKENIYIPLGKSYFFGRLVTIISWELLGFRGHGTVYPWRYLFCGHTNKSDGSSVDWKTRCRQWTWAAVLKWHVTAHYTNRFKKRFMLFCHSNCLRCIYFSDTHRRFSLLLPPFCIAVISVEITVLRLLAPSPTRAAQLQLPLFKIHNQCLSNVAAKQCRHTGAKM